MKSRQSRATPAANTRPNQALISAVEFRAALLAWYDANARDLPWRRTHDPYAIWVSEIMLQQTRVAAVVERYGEFLRAFPTISELAAASESEVLARWSGLGYYRRARMLRRAAQAVVADWGGKLPPNVAALRTLPGIGVYTSAAIASIAFGEPAAVVDGNVERVILRVFGGDHNNTSTAHIQQQVDGLLDRARPGDFNQAMMELGATICLPRNPLCLQCPVVELCQTRGEHPTVPRKKMVGQRAAYALAVRPGKAGPQVLLRQRSAKLTVMPGMWELPPLDAAAVHPDRVLLTVRHAIMSTNYTASVVEVLPAERGLLGKADGRRRWFDPERPHSLPLTGLARKVLLKLGLMPPRKTATESFPQERI